MIARQLIRPTTTVSLARHLTTLNTTTTRKPHIPRTTITHPHTTTTITQTQHRAASSIPSVNMDTAAAADAAKQLIDKVATASEAQIYHWSSVGVAAMFPIGFILSPSFLAMPFDLVLGVALPVHSHIGIVQIIEDYVPRPYQNYSKTVLTVITAITTIGLLKINLCGAGISESFKSLWRNPKDTKYTRDLAGHVVTKAY